MKPGRTYYCINLTVGISYLSDRDYTLVSLLIWNPMETYRSCLYSQFLSSLTVVQNDDSLTFRTCMSHGPNFYRTFDGLAYLYGGRCTYTAFNDGTRSLSVQMVDCHRYSTCSKVGRVGNFCIQWARLIVLSNIYNIASCILEQGKLFHPCNFQYACFILFINQFTTFDHAWN